MDEESEPDFDPSKMPKNLADIRSGGFISMGKADIVFLLIKHRNEGVEEEEGNNGLTPSNELIVPGAKSVQKR